MKRQLKKAFTMIELILVMVVLGVVASMSATIISQVYASYIIQRAMHDSTTKVELAASILYNHLSNRVAITTVGRNEDDNIDIKHVSEILPTDTFSVLEWYGVAIDSFNAGAWNGFCDVLDFNGTTTARISTPGSNLGLLSTIVENTSISTPATTVGDMAIIFSDQFFNRVASPSVAYDPLCMGYQNTSCIATVQGVISGTTIITLDQNYVNMRLSEQYKLVQSAYAIVPVAQSEGDLFDLELRLDYQPWLGENYFDETTPRRVLLENVSVFRFSGIGDTIRFKLCVDERIGTKSDGTPEFVSICKEKAVIR